MPNHELLFSLLRFVALVAPAIAILMQVLQERDSSSTASLRFLEICLLLMVGGGLVIMSQFFRIIGDSTTYFGSVLIFGSLLFLALAIAWDVIPATRGMDLSVSSLTDFLNLTMKAGGKFVGFSIPILAVLGIYYFESGLFNSYLNIGPIREFAEISPAMFFLAVASLIAIRVDFYLINVGYIQKYTFYETLQESVQATLLLYMVVSAFLLPPFLAFYLIVNINSFGVPIKPPHELFAIPYLWTLVIVLVMFAADFWAEEEDGDRLAEV